MQRDCDGGARYARILQLASVEQRRAARAACHALIDPGLSPSAIMSSPASLIHLFNYCNVRLSVCSSVCEDWVVTAVLVPARACSARALLFFSLSLSLLPLLYIPPTLYSSPVTPECKGCRCCRRIRQIALTSSHSPSTPPLIPIRPDDTPAASLLIRLPSPWQPAKPAANLSNLDLCVTTVAKRLVPPQHRARRNPRHRCRQNQAPPRNPSCRRKIWNGTQLVPVLWDHITPNHTTTHRSSGSTNTCHDHATTDD